MKLYALAVAMMLQQAIPPTKPTPTMQPVRSTVKLEDLTPFWDKSDLTGKGPGGSQLAAIITPVVHDESEGLHMDTAAITVDPAKYECHVETGEIDEKSGLPKQFVIQCDLHKADSTPEAKK